MKPFIKDTTANASTHAAAFLRLLSTKLGTFSRAGHNSKPHGLALCNKRNLRVAEKKTAHPRPPPYFVDVVGLDLSHGLLGAVQDRLDMA